MADEDETGLIRSEAAVVVLGDVGRSPRMCNHAKSLADEGFDVKIIGFFESIPNENVINHPRIQIVHIPPPPDSMESLPSFIQLPLKLFWNALTLFWALVFQTSAFNLRVILMQNPPALPTMTICYLVSLFKCSQLTIDWHNYMFSILQNKYGLTMEHVLNGEGVEGKSGRARIVRCVRFLEGLCGKLAHYNLCVTDAMRRDLMTQWGIRATTFYDRPPSWKFKPTSLNEIHNLYLRLSDSEPLLKGTTAQETILTRESPNGSISLLPSRPIVLLSSTSWTPDERFEILLDALVEYDQAAQKQKLPKILMIITGKGPLKSKYLQEIHEKQMKTVDIITPWLEADDYPKILASADLGISLHTSTSGLDLPMKVVDMFGARIPALALKFQCIDELVEERRNGYLFENSEELSRQILELTRGFPENSVELNRLKKNMQENRFESWEAMWKRLAAPGANLTPPDNGFARLRAILQFSFLTIMILFPIHFAMGTFSGYL